MGSRHVLYDATHIAVHAGQSEFVVGNFPAVKCVVGQCHQLHSTWFECLSVLPNNCFQEIWQVMCYHK
jgi:hypothetical protein